MPWAITSGPERVTGEAAEMHRFRWIVEREGDDPHEVIVEITDSAMSTAWETTPSEDRALSATALYAGLRCGELRALLWGDVDLAKGTIRVERSWDTQEGWSLPRAITALGSCPSRPS